ncbi:MAG: 3-dehydroquinate synthase [Actinobacteria bacterium]|nr:3-dehydroquinate synthase [Actinomycetota bacterium]MBO0834878.1 3-dehydroquinate synthase [Actinomycetota bacterium]
MSASRIAVGGERPYQVIIGTGVLDELPSLLTSSVRNVVVIHATSLGGITAAVASRLTGAGYAVHTEPVPDGEAAKELAVAAGLWSRLAAAGVGRDDAIVAVGGGAVTDVAGFVAATWLRGVRIVLVPTTLLGMTDAAIGGKTAINTADGKNLVGAFHPPAGVLADTAVLAGLPTAEYVSGLAEVIKAGFIADPVILDRVEADPATAGRPGGPHERELIERAVAMKVAVVSADLREAGLREMLNYGHTLGHAIERVENYSIRHGEAVAIGMCFAAALGQLAGRLDPVIAARHRSVLAAVGLPVRYHPGAWPELRAAMAVDKKARAAKLRFVVLDGLAKPGILADPAEELLERAYAEVS